MQGHSTRIVISGLCVTQTDKDSIFMVLTVIGHLKLQKALSIEGSRFFHLMNSTKSALGRVYYLRDSWERRMLVLESVARRIVGVAPLYSTR